METSIYLKKVLIFLKQELPEEYRGSLEFHNDKFVLTLPENEAFQSSYQSLHALILTQVNRIRDRQIDLHFTIKSKFQERDFTIIRSIAFDA
ncbi:hypothetical protein [Mucilaginibacter terrae]|uniref:Uncharacterized protein n=1 Tax=Mucilaginibacter terrae TaxID=1955052 RepID=A0ABU3GMP8_9SPHI|nr:hypothetical protein [Mucilaginibacter terrae]MDT3401022.1 hypothetical protein [Mucilaginibacter terrae]